jgi:hypothetical protein
MNQCKTCRYWQPPYDFGPGGSTQGRCTFDASQTNRELNVVTLLAVANSGYYECHSARLYTRAGFGCNQHEERTNVEG